MKKGLGRGFESLIPSSLIDESFDPTAAEDVQISKLIDLAIDLVQPDPGQPRRFFDEKALVELAESVKIHGVVQPIVVTKKDSNYIIVAGERRWRAAKMAKQSTIPAIIRTLSDQHRLEVSLIENLQRRDLNPIETATAYLKLRNQFNMTLEQIGERVGGKSVSAVSNTLRLLKLPKKVQEAIFEGKLTEGQARPMVNLPDQVAESLLERVVSEDWSTRRIEQWITLWKQSTEDETKPVSENGQPHAQALDHFKKYFSSPVMIRTNSKGAGKIVISFRDNSDFERISRLLG